MDLILPKDFSEFIELLNANDVEYLVIGGYAVNAHGYPRFTKDIDFWIWLNEANIDQLIVALKEFGFGSMGLSREHFIDGNSVVQFGYAPLRIDILVDVEGLDFKDCYQRKAVRYAQDMPIYLLGIEDLIKAKELVGRPQDIADVAALRDVLNNSPGKIE